MKILNKFVKLLLRALVEILAVIYSYVIGLIITAPILCVVLTVLSLTQIVPLELDTKFWRYFFLSSIPLSLLIYWSVLTGSSDFKSK